MLSWSTLKIPFVHKIDLIDIANDHYGGRSSNYIKFTIISIEPQPWQSTYNKVWILQHLFSLGLTMMTFQIYNDILKLDSNSIMAGIDFDILNLNPDTSLLANSIE